MQWVGVIPHLLRHLIADVQGVALMVIGMRLAVKVWDINICGRDGTSLVCSSKALLITLNHRVGGSSPSRRTFEYKSALELLKKSLMTW